MKRDLKALTRIFERLGADDPASWAGSEFREDIPQLATFLFLRAAWKRVVAEDDPSWIDAARQPARRPQDPCAGIAPAMERVLAKGVDAADLTEIVRVMQYGLLFDLCYLTSDWSVDRDDLGEVAADVADVGWGLFETDAEGQPLRSLSGVHESLLGMDPTGREMRPR